MNMCGFNVSKSRFYGALATAQFSKDNLFKSLQNQFPKFCISPKLTLTVLWEFS